MGNCCEKLKDVDSKQHGAALKRETHELYGNLRNYKTYHVLTELCTFTGMNKTVSILIRTCDTSQLSKPINFQAEAPTTSHQPKSILETVSIDFTGPLPTGQGGVHYILDLEDTFIKVTKLYSLKRTIEIAILNRMMKDYISKMEILVHILSNNGTQFTATK